MTIATRLAEPDRRLGDRLRGWAAHRWLLVWMMAATRLGDGWAWAALLCILLATGSRGRPLLVAEVATVTAVNALQVALKRSFRRARPCRDPARARPLVLPPDAFSFPSGHTMNAFAFAVLVLPESQALAPLITAYAASVGASRVVLGLHHPSDIGAGALLGALVAAAVRRILLP